jgi:hypothetical protein
MIHANVYLQGLEIDGKPELIEKRTDFRTVDELKDYLKERQRDYTNPGEKIFTQMKQVKGFDVVEAYNEESDFNYFAVITQKV